MGSERLLRVFKVCDLGRVIKGTIVDVDFAVRPGGNAEMNVIIAGGRQPTSMCLTRMAIRAVHAVDPRRRMPIVLPRGFAAAVSPANVEDCGMGLGTAGGGAGGAAEVNRLYLCQRKGGRESATAGKTLPFLGGLAWRSGGFTSGGRIAGGTHQWRHGWLNEEPPAKAIVS